MSEKYFNEQTAVGDVAEKSFEASLRHFLPGKNIVYRWVDPRDLFERKKYDVGVTIYNIGGDAIDYPEFLVEIKNDVRSLSPPYNFGVEFKHYNAPSGIVTTESEYWVILSGDAFHWFLTEELRRFALDETKNWREYRNDSGNTIKLIPIVEMVKIEKYTMKKYI